MICTILIIILINFRPFYCKLILRYKSVLCKNMIVKMFQASLYLANKDNVSKSNY